MSMTGTDVKWFNLVSLFCIKKVQLYKFCNAHKYHTSRSTKKKKNTTIIHNAFQFVSLDINMLCTSYKSIYSTIYTVAVQSIYNHYVNKHMNTIFFSRKKEG